MKFTRYSKYQGELWDDISLEQLLDRLASFLLQSGFDGGYRDRWDDDAEQTLERLRQAIMRALVEEDLLADEEFDLLTDERGNLKADAMAGLIDRLIQRLIEEGYLTIDRPQFAGDVNQRNQRGSSGKAREPRIKFELTDKGLDFLGFKALKELVSSLGKSSIGRHDTRYLSTGVEADQFPKPYEFGDALNLDVNATLHSALRREGLGVPI